MASGPEGRGERILIVEEDDSLRQVMVRILRKRGYEVIEAVDGNDAVIKLEEGPHKIDLLVAGVVMPKMSGGELSERLREADPELKTVLISGSSSGTYLSSSSAAEVLRMPFEPDDLLRLVRTVLDKGTFDSA